MRVVYLQDHDGHKRNKDYFVEVTLGRRLCENGVAVPYNTFIEMKEAEKRDAEKKKAAAEREEARKKAEAEKKAKELLLKKKSERKFMTSKKASKRNKSIR